MASIAAAAAAESALANVVAASPDFARLMQRFGEVRARVKQFGEPVKPGRVRWVDVTTHHVRLIESPLDIRDTLSARVEAKDKAWIFTSATLGDDEGLSWFVKPAGLDRAVVMQLPSPFNYPDQARLHIPRRFPQPSEPEHPQAVAQLALKLAHALGGRTFVLTTTLRALRTISDAMRDAQVTQVGGPAPALQILVQGQSPQAHAAATVPRQSSQRADRIPQLLGRHRRAGRCPAMRDHRQAAVSPLRAIRSSTRDPPPFARVEAIPSMSTSSLKRRLP